MGPIYLNQYDHNVVYENILVLILTTQRILVLKIDLYISTFSNKSFP